MQDVVIIMGANGGIGAATAKIWRESYSSPDQKIILTARNGDSVENGITVDVTNTDDITRLVEYVGDAPIKAFVYAIGSIILKPLKSSQDSDFLSTFDLNVMGAVRVLRALEKNLKAGNGSVVLFSSIAAQQGFTNHTVIAAAKGAVEGVAKALAAEWAPHVRVNVIAPSLTDTGIAQSLTSSPQMAQAIAGLHPIPRLGTPDDSANMAAFLMSDRSSWVTGQVFHVDGGRSALRVKG